MAVFFACLLLAVVVVNYRLHDDLLYPGFLQPLIWFVAIVFFLLTRGTFIRVSEGIFGLFLAGSVLFAMGAFVATHDHHPVLVRNRLMEGSLPSKRVLLGLACVVLVGLVLYVNRASALASIGPSTNPYINLRYALSVTWEETGGDLGVLSYFIPAAYVLAGAAVLGRCGFAHPRLSRLLVAVSVVVGTIFGVLSSGRSVLLPLIIIVLIIPTALRVSSPARTARALGIVVVALFVLVGLALGKGGDFASTIQDNWVGMRESFVLYSVGSIPSFDTFLHNRGPNLDMGINSFRTVLAVLRAVGFGTPLVPLVQPYADIPMPMNVYTVYQPYIKDFGIGGIAAMFFFGFIHGLLYKKATVHNPRAVYVFLFSLSLFPLVMQVFQDMYLSVLSTWIQYSALCILLFGFLSEAKSREMKILVQPT